MASRWLLALGSLVLLALPARADLNFEHTRLDAGKVRAGQPLERRFAFTNQGSEAVQIVSARASCGCAAPQLDGRDYAAGAQGSVLVRVNSLGQPEGAHRWHIHVTYRSGGQIQETVLELAAHIVTEVAVRPAVLTLFAGQALRHEIAVTDRRDKPMRIRAVQASSAQLQTKLSAPGVNAAGQRTWTVGLELARDFPEGRHEEAVTLHTDDPDYAELRVRVTVVKRSARDVTVHPADVRFHAEATGPIASRIVLVRGSNDRAVVVDDVVADHPAVTCKWARGPGNHATVKFTIDRARLDGDTLQTTARIAISAPVREIIDVPIVGTVAR